MVKASRYRAKLRILRVRDFAFDFDIWLIRPPFLGRMRAPVNVYGELVAARFGATSSSSSS
jgi:hypothetical protein